ncbi:MAG: hypothetical protein PWP22_1044 [Thermoanaerobacter sp.]|nr:hypothetical protein [Thermoanaerobacter sp.]
MKIVNVSPFPIYPPGHGGQLRVHNINLVLSKKHYIFAFSMGMLPSEFHPPKSKYTINKINDNYIEYRYIDSFSKFVSKGMIPGTLRTGVLSHILAKSSSKVLQKELSESNLVQVELPWQFEYLYKITPSDIPIVLDEHDVAYELYEKRFRRYNISSPVSTLLVKRLKEKEHFAVENSDIVFVPSKGDKRKLIQEFGVSSSKIYVIPNGVDVDKIKPAEFQEKELLKEKFGFGEKIVILFTGSTHWPNLEAIKKIIDLARKVRDKRLLFLIVGSGGEKFKRQVKLENVVITGRVSEVLPYFKLADIAINTVTSGSGTNVKMLEYMSAGLPIITTEFGARGLDIKNEVHAIIDDIKEFPFWIEMLANNEDLRVKLSKNARKLVEKKYSWEVIGKKVDKTYRKLIR